MNTVITSTNLITQLENYRKKVVVANSFIQQEIAVLKKEIQTKLKEAEACLMTGEKDRFNDCQDDIAAIEWRIMELEMDIQKVA